MGRCLVRRLACRLDEIPLPASEDSPSRSNNLFQLQLLVSPLVHLVRRWGLRQLQKNARHQRQVRPAASHVRHLPEWPEVQTARARAQTQRQGQ